MMHKLIGARSAVGVALLVAANTVACGKDSKGKSDDGGTSTGGESPEGGTGTGTGGSGSGAGTGGKATSTTGGRESMSGGTSSTSGGSSSSTGGASTAKGGASSTTGGASSTTGGTSSPATGGTAGGTSIVTDALPADRRVDWKPGVPGGIPNRTTVCATVDATKYGDGKADATKAIQAAIDACPAGQVVMVPAGTYVTSATLSINKGVVLRGAGPTATKVQLTNSSVDAVLRIGEWDDWSTGVALTAGLEKGSKSLTVANAANFAVGDTILVDQLDDRALVLTGDCNWYKRNNNGANVRSVAQIVEVTGKTGSVLQIDSPLYMNYSATFKAEVSKLTPRVRDAGVEDMYLTRTSAYDDQGFIIQVANATNSWVRNVETYKVSGRHIALWACHHCEVRDSFVHHGWNYDSGGSAYGITLDLATTDSLVENNIVYYHDIPISFEASGGGNVVAYNYVDDPILGQDPAWQMTDIDTHCSWPHMELVEGNWVGRIMPENTHGASGYLTLFRNRATGVHLTLPNTGNLGAIVINGGAYYINVLGNVLWTEGLKGIYEDTSCGDDSPYRIGFEVDGNICGKDPRVLQTLLRHGNYDYVTKTTVWDPKIASKELPPSLYLTAKPAFFGDNPWPLVDSARMPMVGVLPAKARFDALGKKGNW
jgi:hypothetical protein